VVSPVPAQEAELASFKFCEIRAACVSDLDVIGGVEIFEQDITAAK
jgi:hypothetical protein